MTAIEKSLITLIQNINEGKLTFADWKSEIELLAGQIGKKIVVDQVDEVVSDEMTKRELISTTVFCSHYGSEFIFFKTCQIEKETDLILGDVFFNLIIYNDLESEIRDYKRLNRAEFYLNCFKETNIHLFE